MPRLPDSRFTPDCTILLDGRQIAARIGESVTSALIAAGRPLIGRSAKYHRPRGPFCLSSSCITCLARVEGVPNVRTCEIRCREGLRVETQNVIGGAEHDLLGSIDLVAVRGLDHHHLVTWSQIANRLTVSISRHLAGLGRLPDQVAPPWPPASHEHFDAVVVGAGPAGLGAAEVLAGKGRRPLLCEKNEVPGGRLRCQLRLAGDPPLTWVGEVVESVRRSGGEVALGAEVFGLWYEGGEWLVVMLHRGDPPRLRLARSHRVVLANGTWAQPPVFEQNDLPGIYSARGLTAALAENGVVPGERAAVLGSGAESEAVAARLTAAGMAVRSVTEEVERALGRGRVTGIRLASGSQLECDTVAVATPGTAALELARQAGAALELDPQTGTFHLRPDDRGSVAPGAFAVGEVIGSCQAVDAVRNGRQIGEEVARG